MIQFQAKIVSMSLRKFEWGKNWSVVAWTTSVGFYKDILYRPRRWTCSWLQFFCLLHVRLMTKLVPSLATGLMNHVLYWSCSWLLLQNKFHCNHSSTFSPFRRFFELPSLSVCLSVSPSSFVTPFLSFDFMCLSLFLCFLVTSLYS